jgi:replicative DNA helicase
MSIGGGSGLLSLKETAELLLSNSERYYNDTSLIRAVPSFLPQLTNVLGGGDGAYWESELIILAARPGMGKTAWLIQELIHAAKLGHCPAFFSLEMPSTSIVARVVSQMTGLDARDITLGRLKDDEWKAYYNAVGNLSEWGAYLSDDVYSLNGIVNEIVKLASRQEVGIVFIDYLTLINSDERSQNKNAEVELMVRSIRQKIARELKVPVVLAAQLSRNVESRQDKRPMLSDLRDSGAIEQTADKVLFLYRDDYYNPDTSEKPGIAEVLVRKNRNGQNNIDIDVEWSGKTTQFIPLTKKEAFDENNP